VAKDRRNRGQNKNREKVKSEIAERELRKAEAKQGTREKPARVSRELDPS